MSSQRATALSKDMVPMSDRHNQVLMTKTNVTNGLCAVSCKRTYLCHAYQLHRVAVSCNRVHKNIHMNSTSETHDLKLGTIWHINM